MAGEINEIHEWELNECHSLNQKENDGYQCIPYSKGYLCKLKGETQQGVRGMEGYSNR